MKNVDSITEQMLRVTFGDSIGRGSYRKAIKLINSWQECLAGNDLVEKKTREIDRRVPVRTRKHRPRAKKPIEGLCKVCNGPRTYRGTTKLQTPPPGFCWTCHNAAQQARKKGLVSALPYMHTCVTCKKVWHSAYEVPHKHLRGECFTCYGKRDKTGPRQERVPEVTPQRVCKYCRQTWNSKTIPPASRMPEGCWTCYKRLLEAEEALKKSPEVAETIKTGE